ncbi:hypothetical protein Pmani_006667 [Petrolisthes manimaculis]|uniref:Uncharacterized protein n=1 Tax=Petrolisthes manimaculis TaxID=1843537 RepID=A0AAE1QCE3_9EUCA|nr:hypothetical protein Pmani_006667 [Petrolisthes manimaculis]
MVGISCTNSVFLYPAFSDLCSQPPSSSSSWLPFIPILILIQPPSSSSSSWLPFILILILIQPPSSSSSSWLPFIPILILIQPPSSSFPSSRPRLSLSFGLPATTTTHLSIKPVELAMCRAKCTDRELGEEIQAPDQSGM